MAPQQQSPMTPHEAREAFDTLGLTRERAARLLGLTDRTLKRYLDEAEEIPGPVQQALRAWVALHQRGLPWRPDQSHLVAIEPTDLARQNMQALRVEACIDRVIQRGGPKLPWDVDLEWGVAVLGSMKLTFCEIADGGFVPLSYSRDDLVPDLQRDWELLEEGIACIARSFEHSELPVRPRPRVGWPNQVSGAYLLWDDASPPGYVARIDAAVVAELAEVSESANAECWNFLNANRPAIARAAEAARALGGEVDARLGVEILQLGKHALMAAGLKRPRVRVALRAEANGRELTATAQE